MIAAVGYDLAVEQQGDYSADEASRAFAVKHFARGKQIVEYLRIVRVGCRYTFCGDHKVDMAV